MTDTTSISLKALLIGLALNAPVDSVRCPPTEWEAYRRPWRATMLCGILEGMQLMYEADPEMKPRRKRGR